MKRSDHTLRFSRLVFSARSRPRPVSRAPEAAVEAGSSGTAATENEKKDTHTSGDAF